MERVISLFMISERSLANTDVQYFLDREEEIYEILDVPTSTSLTLKETYIGDTGSGLSYLIWKRYYDLPPDVHYNSGIELWKFPYRSQPIPKLEMNSIFKQSHLRGYPAAWAFSKFNRAVSTYNTGTVSIPKDSNTLTGSGTSWIGNVFEGTKITIGSNSYNVETVDKDTQITLVQKSKDAVQANTKYSAETKNRTQIMFSTVPDPVVNMNVTYYKKPYPLVNDNDELNIWEGYEHIVINAVLGELLAKTNEEGEGFAWLTTYESQIQEAYKTILANDPIDTAVVDRPIYPQGYRPSLYG